MSILCIAVPSYKLHIFLFQIIDKLNTHIKGEY